MSKSFLVLVSLLATVSAWSDDQTPQTPPAPQATGPSHGMSGIRFVQAPVPMDSHCSSVILQGNSGFLNEYFVLPRVFLSQNQAGRSEMELVPPSMSGDPWRLRFNLFFPHNVNATLASRKEATAGEYGHGCNFTRVEEYLNQRFWTNVDTDPSLKEKYRDIRIRYSDPAKHFIKLLPAHPYKVMVSIPGFPPAQIGSDDSSITDLYGDKTVEFETTDKNVIAKFIRDFDSSGKRVGDPHIGVPVKIDIRFSGSRADGEIDCSFDASKLETNLKSSLSARGALTGTPAAPFIDLAKVNLKAEIANAAFSARGNCTIDASANDAFSAMSNSIVASLLSDPQLDPNLAQMMQNQSTLPGGNLPGSLPPLPGSFSPLPPLPNTGGLPPCTDQSGNPIPPAQFAQLFPGSPQCSEIGNGMDDGKKRISFRLMFSRIKEKTDKGIHVKRNAAATDEVFTTYTNLKGRMKTPWEEPARIRSTMLSDGKAPPYSTGIEMRAGRQVVLVPKFRNMYQYDYSQPDERYATWTDILQLRQLGVKFGPSVEMASSEFLVTSKRKLPAMEVEQNGGVETEYPVFYFDPVQTWYFGAGRLSYKIVTRRGGVGRSRQMELSPEDPANGIAVGFSNNGNTGRAEPMSAMISKRAGDGWTAEVVDVGNEKGLRITAKQDLGKLVLYNMDKSACLDSPAGECNPTWRQRVYVNWTGANGTFINGANCRDFTSVQGQWVSGCPGYGAIAGQVANLNVGYLKSYDRDEYKEPLEKAVSAITVGIELPARGADDPKDVKLLIPDQVSSALNSAGNALKTSDGNALPPLVVVGTPEGSRSSTPGVSPHRP